MYEVTSVDTGRTKYMTQAQAEAFFGKVEFKEILDGYLPHIVAVEVDPVAVSAEILEAKEEIEVSGMEPTERKLRDLASAVALILILDNAPSTDTETVELAPKTRTQLRKALGMD